MYINLLSGLLFTFFSCNAQQKEEQQEVSLVQTDWERYNLKGKVQELKTTYERFYADTLPTNVIGRYEFFRNDFDYMERLPTGYYLFTNEGFFVKNNRRYQDSLFLFSVLNAKNDTYTYMYVYDTTDLKEKQKIKGRYKYLYPIYDPYDVKINNKWIQKKQIQDSILYFNDIYEYTINNNGLVSEEKYYMGSREGYKDFHHRRKAYHHDDKNRVVAVDLFFREEPGVPPLPFDFTHIDYFGMLYIPVQNKIRYEYDYDDNDRITEVRFRLDDAVIWSETYRYNRSSRKPSELDRFIVSARTSGVFISDNATEWYNEHADIVKVEYYDNRSKEVIHTRFYDYEYDEHNNWIVCRMYLEGAPARTENPTRIAYRTITYYPE